MRKLAIVLTMVASGITGCCEIAPRIEDRNVAGTQPADLELRDALRQLTKMHNDRLKLALMVGIPFMHKVDKEIADFIKSTKDPNEDLLNELEAYGKSTKADLNFVFAGGVFPQAQKRMEAMQGDYIMSAKDDFGFYVLMFSFMDYCFGESLIERTLQQTKNIDPALKTILEKDLKMHQDMSGKIGALIMKYKG